MRKWIDTFANHGARVRRHVERQGITAIEEFIDTCLSLENLIDPPARMLEGRSEARPEGRGRDAGGASFPGEQLHGLVSQP
jgi:stage V sporulation protein R